jgi:hypothetical protein
MARFTSLLFLTALLWTSALTSANKAQDPKPSPLKLTLRWAETSHQPEVTQEKGVDLSCSDGKAYLHKTPIVTEADIVSASAHPDNSGKHYLILKLNKKAAEALGVTWNRLGEKPIVVEVDGKIVFAMVPKTKLETDVPVLGRFSAAEAARIVEGLTKK